MSTVKDPTANNNSGFLWGIGVLLVIKIGRAHV